jgi:hypothetical protein
MRYIIGRLTRLPWNWRRRMADGDTLTIVDGHQAFAPLAITQAVYSANVTLTHAEVLTLVFTPVELVPAQGSGMVVVPIGGFIALIGPAAYTNVHSTATFGFMTEGGGFSYDKWEALSLLTFGVDAVLPLTIANRAGTPTVGVDVPDSFTDKALMLQASNNVNGNFTGGDAANVLKVTVLYTIVDVL